MKRSILAAAALSAFAAPTFAQSSVTIYGIADLGADMQRGGVAGTIYKVSSGIQSGSRLGFKGTLEVAPGLSALFVMEMGVSLDTGASNQGGLVWGRQAYAGLRTDYGSLTLGRQYTAVNNALCGDIDPFGCGTAGHAGNLMSVGGTPTNGGNGSRTNNAIKFTSVDYSGVKGELTFAPGEVAGNHQAGHTLGGSIGYTKGLLTLRLAHNSVVNPTNTHTANVTFLGGKLDAGPAVLALGYAINKGAFSANSNIANPDSRDILAGVSVPIGAGSLLASYIKRDDRFARNNASQAAIGYSYALSKALNLYTAYAHIHNTAPNTNAAAFYTVGNAIDAGTGDSAFNVGGRLAF